MNGLGRSCSAIFCIAIMPMRLEPVNTRPSMSAFSRISADTSSSGPVMKWHTSAGTPASRKHWKTCQPLRTPFMLGLMMAALPVSRAAAAMPNVMAMGKLNGQTTPKTPTGLRTERHVSLGNGFPMSMS